MKLADAINSLIRPLSLKNLSRKSTKYLALLGKGESILSSIILFTITGTNFSTTTLLENMSRGQHKQYIALLTTMRLILITEDSWGRTSKNVQDIPISEVTDIKIGSEIVDDQSGVRTMHAWQFVIVTKKGPLLLGVSDLFKKEADDFIAAYQSLKTT